MHACEKCKKTYVQKSLLNRHVKSVYSETFTQSFKFTCDCGRHFSDNRNYGYHLRNAHHFQLWGTAVYMCSLCKFKSIPKHLRTHYQEEHEVKLCCETLQFESLNQFDDWKRQFERNEKAKFIKHHVAKKVYILNI